MYTAMPPKQQQSYAGVWSRHVSREESMSMPSLFMLHTNVRIT